MQACIARERAAGELAEHSSLAAASVSEHLKVLRKAGVLILEVRGRYWLYRTNSALVRAALAALAPLGRKR